MYLVIGGGGFLGSYTLKAILNITNEEIIATSRDISSYENSDRVTWYQFAFNDPDNIRDLNKLLNGYSKVKVIFLPAFFNTKDKPEEKKTAWQANVVDYANFLKDFECPDLQCFYNTSTDMLFKHSRDEAYSEHDDIAPMNDYARDKAIQERMCQALGYNIVRFPVMMGPSLSPKKKHFFDAILSSFKAGKSMQFFTDAWRSMLDFETAAQMLVRLTQCEKARNYPVVNIAGDESLSKYEMACRIADKHGFSRELAVPVSIDDDKTIWNGTRPKKVLLDNTLLKKILGIDSVKFKVL